MSEDEALKAVVLAGGSGSRAKPFTDYSPKPMIPLFDRPIIDYIVRYLSSFDVVDEVIVVTNLSGRGRQIQTYFEGKEVWLKKKLVFAADRNEGTGNAILRTRSRLVPGEPFLVWFSDNICPLNVEDMLRFHRKMKGLGCVAVRKRRIEETGFVEVDEKMNLVKRFMEKPTVDLPLPECLGVYLFSYDVIKKMSSLGKAQLNLSLDVLQNLSADDKFYAYQVGNLPWLDVESPAKLERHLQLAKKIVNAMEKKVNM